MSNAIIHKNKNIDCEQGFDWGLASNDYARYRDIYFADYAKLSKTTANTDFWMQWNFSHITSEFSLEVGACLRRMPINTTIIKGVHSMNKKILALFTASFVLFTMMSGCGSTAQKKGEETSSSILVESEVSSHVSESTVSRSAKEQISGSLLSKIKTTTLDGDTITGADIAGENLTILNVWATWCPPCVEEIPYLEEISVEYADKGVSIVGVMQDGVTKLLEPDEKTIQAGKSILETAGAKYITILPDEALTTSLISQMQYFPTTFFINADGEVIKTVIGANDVDDWKKKIDDALATLS